VAFLQDPDQDEYGAGQGDHDEWHVRENAAYRLHPSRTMAPVRRTSLPPARTLGTGQRVYLLSGSRGAAPPIRSTGLEEGDHGEYPAVIVVGPPAPATTRRTSSSRPAPGSG